MDPKIICAPAEMAQIPKKSAGKILFDRMNTFEKNSIALMEINSGSVSTYGQLLNSSLNLASNLRKSLQIAKNDNMAIIGENSSNFLVCMLAGLYLGAPCHLLNPGYTTHELKKFLFMSKPRLIFCSQSCLSKIKEIKNDCPFLKYVVVFDGQDDGIIDFGKLISGNCNSDFVFEKIHNLDDQVAYIANSSGTTGLPKGAMITHGNLRLNLSHSADDELSHFDDQSVVIHIMPFYHVYGLGVAYCGLYRGVKMLTMSQFNPKIYLENIQKHKANKVFVVPTLGDFLANNPLVQRYDLSSIEEIYLAAGVLRKDTEDKILKKFNLKSIRRVYGLTELASGVFITPIGVNKPGTCGKVTSGHQVKIVDVKTGETLGFNQTGELCIKGCAMKGYINDDEKTRAAFDSDGFVRTGDIAYYDEDYYFYIIDRLKDLIKYKSFQVAPLEIEEILLRHGKIEDAAVVGKPDDRYGELPVAFVVKKQGVEISEEEIVDHVAEFVCVEKRLHGGVKFVDKLPRNGIGKILRKDLRNMLQ